MPTAPTAVIPTGSPAAPVAAGAVLVPQPMALLITGVLTNGTVPVVFPLLPYTGEGMDGGPTFAAPYQGQGLVFDGADEVWYLSWTNGAWDASWIGIGGSNTPLEAIVWTGAQTETGSPILQLIIQPPAAPPAPVAVQAVGAASAPTAPGWIVPGPLPAPARAVATITVPSNSTYLGMTSAIRINGFWVVLGPNNSASASMIEEFLRLSVGLDSADKYWVDFEVVGNVIYMTAAEVGIAGNYALAKNADAANLVLSGANFTGGIDRVVVVSPIPIQG